MDKMDVNQLCAEVSKLTNAVKDQATKIDGRLEGIRENLQRINEHLREISEKRS